MICAVLFRAMSLTCSSVTHSLITCFTYLQKKRKYGAVDNMTSTATMSSSALRQNQRKKTMAMTNMQEIRKRTLDGAVAYTSNENV